MTTLGHGASGAPPPEIALAQEQAAETWTAYTLRAGVLTSSILIGVGYVLSLLHHGPLPVAPHSVVEISSLAVAMDPVGIASLGLFILVATSFLRVIVAVVLFALERDRAFFLVSAGVFAILVASLLLGKVE